MEALIWSVATLDGFTWASPLAQSLLILMVMCWDTPILLLYRWFQRAFGLSRTTRDANAAALPVLVVIPSLLRRRDELVSMMSTVESVANNGYPGDLTIVVTIDGIQDAPRLYAELRDWAGQKHWNDRTRLWITGTEARRSKPMAIHHGMEFVQRKVADGSLAAFPPVYVSTDADADLGPSALERIVYRLQRRNRMTGSPARVVAGALHVRGNDFWRGLRHFFTMDGQLNLQVAREYYVGNIWRYNIRWLPITGVPGAFYCTWSEIFLAIPEYMGYMRTLRRRHWFAWWLGTPAPKFSETKAEPIPELMAGDTDDTVTAYVATLVRYEDGHFSLDPPRTPAHALLQMLRCLFWDRPLRFEPDAHVFTSSPTTARALFKQRKRWNSSRVELTGRFWPVLGYHWALGMPVTIVKMLMARTIVVGVLAYLLLPAFFWDSHVLTALVFGYLGNVVTYTVMTVAALLINGDFRYWRMLLSVPIGPAYQFVFNWIPGTIGVTSDVLLFGNRTGFAPESTLIRGGSRRLAILFRLRRALLLAVRSVMRGDVPFGAFWFGWHETAWTPNGFEGWTSGERPRSILRSEPQPSPSEPPAHATAAPHQARAGVEASVHPQSLALDQQSSFSPPAE